MKEYWCQQYSRGVLHGLSATLIFFRQDITVSSFFIVGYVWQILAPSPLPIREKPRKGSSWIGLKLNAEILHYRSDI